jgi:predicted HTH transcriptional regulator
MIAKNLTDIVPADIEALVANAASESTTLEFKRDLPGGGDEAKREFLADLSALANSAGGDILYGIDEREGVAATITGIGITDTDTELLRLGNILNSGLEPRIRYSPMVIQCASGTVLLLRIEKSWNGPHRVIFRGYDRFFGRTATGKYPLDVQQLRRAFVENSTVAERLRAFRAERMARRYRHIDFAAGCGFVVLL